MLPNLAKLVEKCEKLGYQPKPSGKRLSKEDCTKILRQHYLPEGGLAYQELTPMLCFASWNLKPEELEEAWESDKWVAQRKLNGCRAIIHFVAGKGIFVHSRTVSLKTYRFQELSRKFLFRDVVPDFTATIDAEVMIEKPIDTRPYTAKGEVTKSSLHSTTSALHLADESSIKVQTEQDAALQVFPFDITNWEGVDIRQKSLKVRLEALSQFMTKVKHLPMGKDFHEMEVCQGEKKAFYDGIISQGGEGVILKNLSGLYEDSSSRSRAGWVKVKRRREHDAFVTGFKPGDPDSGWVDLVGALEFSVHTTAGGKHVLGYATNIPLEERKRMTETGPDGKPRLRQEFYGRVAEISGQDLSAREIRLSHCTLNRWRDQAGDTKRAEDCVEDLAVLKQIAEWAG